MLHQLVSVILLRLILLHVFLSVALATPVIGPYNEAGGQEDGRSGLRSESDSEIVLVPGSSQENRDHTKYFKEAYWFLASA